MERRSTGDKVNCIAAKRLHGQRSGVIAQESKVRGQIYGLFVESRGTSV